MDISIRVALVSDLPVWTRMRSALWPQTTSGDVLATEARSILESTDTEYFVAVFNDETLGFIEVSERRYAEGCESSPVAFVEGWWVEESARRHGVGRALMNATATWARDRGHTELGSDTWHDHLLSVEAHRRLGFDVVETTTHFRLSLIEKAPTPTTQGYDLWAKTYDSVNNKTRDLAHRIAKTRLSSLSGSILDVGCGTGTLLAALQHKFGHLTGFDASGEMLAIARSRLPEAHLVQADLSQTWPVDSGSLDVVSETLVLEHIESLDHFYAESFKTLRVGGTLLVVEFHPVRQAAKRRARFEAGGKTVELVGYQHTMATMVNPALNAGLTLREVVEHRTDEDNTPRLLELVFVR